MIQFKRNQRQRQWRRRRQRQWRPKVYIVYIVYICRWIGCADETRARFECRVGVAVCGCTLRTSFNPLSCAWSHVFPIRQCPINCWFNAHRTDNRYFYSRSRFLWQYSMARCYLLVWVYAPGNYTHTHLKHVTECRLARALNEKMNENLWRNCSTCRRRQLPIGMAHGWNEDQRHQRTTWPMILFCIFTNDQHKHTAFRLRAASNFPVQLFYFGFCLPKFSVRQ